MANEHDEEKARSCPFCREVASEEDGDEKIMKRVKADDPAALSQMAADRFDEGDYDTALEYWTKAAELGNLDAHYKLALMYNDGRGVEKNMKKEVYHCEEAAVGGHPIARYNLACYEWSNGNIERAAKHHIIAAKLGFDMSMKALWGAFKHGQITKEDLDATLRSHQAAIDATKSAQRDAAEEKVRQSIPAKF